MSIEKQNALDQFEFCIHQCDLILPYLPADCIYDVLHGGMVSTNAHAIVD